MTTLQFLGAAGTVTGSKFVLDAGGTRCMIDCGMFQGAKKWRLLNWDQPAVAPDSLDHVILTHAHIDHVGMLPRFARDGFRGPAWCTPATRDLAEITLLDAAHLQEEDARYANRKGFTKHKPALPLYTTEDAERAVRALRPVDYGQRVSLSDGVEMRFLDAGHILGSGIVEASWPDGDQSRRIVFSGDLGRFGASILRDPQPPARADYLVVESTYGNRSHPQEDPGEELAPVIRKTAGRGGTLVVPAFALGRTQKLLYEIRALKEGGKIPDLPVYVDSPMAVDVTELFCRYIDTFDKEAREIFETTGQCPVLCPNLKLVSDTEGSKALGRQTFPSIIISASGMATGGRILHHLKQRLPESRNTVLFIGFQAAGTRGQILKDGVREIKIHGKYVPVRAEILGMESFSAHADAGEILRWLRAFETPPRRTFIVHGEPSASAALQERIRSELGWETHIPDHLETVRLD